MSYKPKVLEVAAGGTGASTLTGVLSGNGTSAVTASAVTQYDVLVGGASNAISSIGPGSSGQVLQSAGNAANPAYSTATYPATATGTGKILRADGANWAASTATYPDTAGISGNVLTSDGNNFVSSALPSSLNVATITLTSAQIKALHGTPVVIVAAPGANKVVCVQGVVYSSFNYGGSNVFVAGALQVIKLYYGTSLEITSTSLIVNSIIVGTTSVLTTAVVPGVTPLTRSNLVNKDVTAYVSQATEISGNAANDNTVTITFLYYIATL